MADLSTLLGINTSTMSQSELLMDAFKRTQQFKVDALNQKKTELEQRQSFFNTLNTKISALLANIDTFTASSADDKFVTRSITSSDSSVISASAGGTASVGISQVFVDRLATNDILISDQLALSGSFGESAGTKNFDITINGATTAVSVVFDGTETNEEALTKIANAINSTEDVGVTAAYIKDTPTTGRLTLTSEETGSDDRVTFTDTDNMLSRIGFIVGNLNPDTTNRTVATDTVAGYQTADYNDLNSQLTVNGINVIRTSNTIDDLLTGVALTLLKPQETGDLSVTLNTSIDTDAVESLIKPLLDNFNSLLAFIQSNKNIRRTDSIIQSLNSNLRGLISNEVTGLDEDAPSYLAEIGIKIGTDGQLSISDSDTLQGFLEDDPQKVADLFTSEDSFVAKINAAISRFSGNDGLIKSRTLSISSQIDTTVKRTTELEERIDRQAESLRKEYEDMLRVMLEAEAQFNTLSGFSGGISYY